MKTANRQPCPLTLILGLICFLLIFQSNLHALIIGDDLDVQGYVELDNEVIINGKTALLDNGTWLQLNPDNEYSSGVDIVGHLQVNGTLTVSSGINADTLDNYGSTAFPRKGEDAIITGAYRYHNNLAFSGVSGLGIKFWNDDDHKIYMSGSGAGAYGGRLDSVSDFNIYFNISDGINRGFVFKNNGNAVAQIDGAGVGYFSGLSLPDNSIQWSWITGMPSGLDDGDDDTTYAIGNGGLTEINFTQDLYDKLVGIEAGAEVNTDNQQLSLVGDTLSLTGEVPSSVDLSSYATDSDVLYVHDEVTALADSALDKTAGGTVTGAVSFENQVTISGGLSFSDLDPQGDIPMMQYPEE